MGWVHAELDRLEWTPGNHPLEEKKVGAGGITLLRFAPGFSDPNWCERSHLLFVVEGTLCVDFRERRVEVSAGQALWLDGGTAHRASVPGAQAAIVLAASDLRREQG
jgi:quercetin dioxygenase-like cupin family protein